MATEKAPFLFEPKSAPEAHKVSKELVNGHMPVQKTVQTSPKL